MLIGSDQALLPPLPLLLQRLAAAEGHQAVLAGLALDHQALPICALISDLTTYRHRLHALPAQAHWSVHDHAVELQHEDHAVDDEGVLITGALAAPANTAAPLDGRFINPLRLDEARAIIDADLGADWRRWLDHDPSMPPLAALSGKPLDQFANTWQAWNPLPVHHTCLIQAPLGEGPAPWALIDDDGGQYPIQVVHSPTGPWVLSQCALGPLQCRRLYPHDDPVDACWWEVSAEVLDNGRVRLEFTPQGTLRRVCLDGVFLPLAGPGMVPMRDDKMLAGRFSAQVIEDGPVRARLAFSWRDEHGTARIVYSVHAQEASWQMQTTWLGPAPAPTWHIPTMWRRGLWRWGSMSGHHAAEACQDGTIISTPFAHWATLGDQDQREGIALASACQALSATVQRGVIGLGTGGPITCAAWPLPHPVATLGLSQLLHGRIHDGGDNREPLYRLLDSGSLVPQWLRPIDRHTVELLVVEHHGGRGKAQLLPQHLPEQGSSAWVCDMHGSQLEQLRPTADNDGWIIPYNAGAILPIRWQVR